MIKLKTIGFIIAAVAMAGCFTPQAHAQQAPGTVADAISRALFDQSGDIYRNAGVDRQATLLFGLSFPDHEALNDTKSVHNIYQDAIRQRGSAPVRTTDLPNPFNSSLLTNPPKN
jgi:hypothetical protein